MSRGINKVILVGNATQDPDCRFMPNGNQVSSLSIATNEYWVDKATGEKKEKAEFHRVVFFGKLAEIVGQYVHKGSKLYVEGRLQTRKWTDQQGIERYSTEVIVDMGGTMQLLDSRQGNDAGGGYHNPNQAPQQQRQQQATTNNHPAYGGQQRPQQQNRPPQQSQQAAPPNFDDFDDLIPF